MTNLHTALEKAKEALRGWSVTDLVANSGVEYDAQAGELVIPWCGEPVRLVHPEAVFKEMTDGQLPTLEEQVLILHYLVSGVQKEPSGEWISFRELPGGQLYMQPFKQRAIRPLIQAFGSRPGDLLTASKALGGTPGGWAEASVILHPFPFLPIAILLWGGDDEFPAEGSFLFDTRAPNWLPTEDYVVLASLVARKLVRQSKRGEN